MSIKTVYWKQNCPHCENAKNLMMDKGEAFHTQEIGSEISVDDFKKAYPNVRSVPLIVESDGTIIGGYDDLVEYYDNSTEGN